MGLVRLLLLCVMLLYVYLRHGTVQYGMLLILCCVMCSKGGGGVEASSGDKRLFMLQLNLNSFYDFSIFRKSL